jgi:hypothetical protein
VILPNPIRLLVAGRYFEASHPRKRLRNLDFRG